MTDGAHQGLRTGPDKAHLPWVPLSGPETDAWPGQNHHREETRARARTYTHTDLAIFELGFTTLPSIGLIL